MSGQRHPRWKKFDRIALLGTRAFLAALLLLVVGYSGLGHWKWHQTRKELLARGEKLALAELAPPQVPDEQNFFADPIWREVVGESALPKGKRELDTLNAELGAQEIQALEAKYPALRWKSNLKNRSSIARAVWYYSAPNYVLNKQDAANFTLALFARVNPVMERVKHLSGRPSARLPFDYSSVTFERDTPEATYLYQAAETLIWESRAKLELGDREGAKADIFSLARLSGVMSKEPLLWPMIIRASIAGMCAGPIQKGIAAHAWTDIDLQAFEEMLAPIDLLKQLPLALRGERGAFNQFAANFQVPKSESAANAWERISYRVLDKACALSFIPGDQAFYNRAMQQKIDSADSVSRQGLGMTKVADPVMEERQFGRLSHLFSDVFMFAVPDAMVSVAFKQNLLNQTRIACALERYRLKSGACPVELEALTPAFLPALPVDVITLKLMRYQLLKPDEFRLWSVGWDEKDEGGKSGERKGSKAEDWVWGQNTR